MARSGMNKEVAIRYTGDTKDFKRAAADAKRIIKDQSDQVKAKNAEMAESFKKTTIAIAKIGAVLGSAKIAFEVYKKVVSSTEGGADKFRESTDYAKGAVKGLFQTMASGGWESFLSNIRLTAEATRDFGKAIDEISDRLAGDKIQIGQWEGKLQEARLAYAEFKDSDSAKAKEAVEDAIYYQKAITSLTIQQLKERAKATEDYWFKKDNNLNKSQFDWVIKQFPLIAKSQRMLLTPEYMEMLEKANDKASKNMLAAIKNFIYFRDTLSEPDQFNTYIEGLGQIAEAAARGDQELVRLTKQLAAFNKEVQNISKTSALKRPDISNLKVPQLSILGGLPTTPGLAGAPKSPVQEMTGGLEAQLDLVNRLQGAFEGMASAAMQGGNVLKNMADVMIDSIKRIAAELIAKAATFMILKLLFPGLFQSMELYKKGSFGNFVSGGLFGGMKSGTPVGMASQNMSVNVIGKLAGQDIYLSAARYGNMLNGNT